MTTPSEFVGKSGVQKRFATDYTNHWGAQFERLDKSISDTFEQYKEIALRKEIMRVWRLVRINCNYGCSRIKEKAEIERIGKLPSTTFAHLLYTYPHADCYDAFRTHITEFVHYVEALMILTEGENNVKLVKEGGLFYLHSRKLCWELFPRTVVESREPTQWDDEIWSPRRIPAELVAGAPVVIDFREFLKRCEAEPDASQEARYLSPDLNLFTYQLTSTKNFNSEGAMSVIQWKYRRSFQVDDDFRELTRGGEALQELIRFVKQMVAAGDVMRFTHLISEDTSAIKIITSSLRLIVTRS